MGREIIAPPFPPHGLEAWHLSLWGFLPDDLQEPTDPQSGVPLMGLPVEKVGMATSIAQSGGLALCGHFEFFASHL